MGKKQNQNEIRQGLKAKDWFLCAHCKKDYKHTRTTGVMTCLDCKKKGLNDEAAIKIAEELTNMNRRQEREEYHVSDDVEFMFDARWEKLPIEALKNKKIRKIIKIYSSLYDFTSRKAHLQNIIVADIANKRIHEELDEKGRDKLVNSLLTGIQAKQIVAGIIIIQAGLNDDGITALKEKAINKLPDTKIRFLTINRKYAGHTLMNAIFFGNFQFPLDDGCC